MVFWFGICCVLCQFFNSVLVFVYDEFMWFEIQCIFFFQDEYCFDDFFVYFNGDVLVVNFFEFVECYVGFQWDMFIIVNMEGRVFILELLCYNFVIGCNQFFRDFVFYKFEFIGFGSIRCIVGVFYLFLVKEGVDIGNVESVVC